MKLKLPKMEEMPRQTLKRGEIIGSLPLKELPNSVKSEMVKLWKTRYYRDGDAALTATVGVTATNPQGYRAIPFGIIMGGLFARSNSRVRNQTREIGKETNRFRNNEQFKQFMERGATHVFMSRKGDLHFVKAPEHEGKAFRPIIGRLRAPLTSGKK